MSVKVIVYSLYEKSKSMRRFPIKKALSIGIVLTLLLSLPMGFVNPIRRSIVALLSPLWKRTQVLPFKSKEKLSYWEKTAKRLEMENHLMGLEIYKLRAALEQQGMQQVLEGEATLLISKGHQRRAEEAKHLAQAFQTVVPATVIYRDPSSWSSSVWIDVGEVTNEKRGKTIIQKNSPVVLGRAVVGVIDEVGRHQSRVRLITDSALHPSVRVARGHAQNLLLLEQIDYVTQQLKSRKDFNLAVEQKEELQSLLQKLRNEVEQVKPTWALAKGVLQGMGKPLWRGGGKVLKGFGFNYDFPDEEGPARDLQTGQPVPADARIPALTLIQKGDLLVTTGYDRVFPAGLWVAEVSKVFPLREGSYTFDIEAIPIASSLDELRTVFILPALSDK